MSAEIVPLLELRDVKKYYRSTRGALFGSRSRYLKAVDGVSMRILAGTTYSLVGETGAGKTTVGRLVLGIEQYDSGEVFFGGLKVFGRDARRSKDYASSSISAVFQDPWSSLNPRMKVRDIITEPLVAHRTLSHQMLKKRLDELMDLVGLSRWDADHYPHEFSGGQRQRVAIARAISASPKLIVLDEPVSSLDVSIKAQIMNLLKTLQIELGISYLLIAHDLGTVRFMSHRVGVMYMGKIVEEADARDFYSSPLHPYTRLLIAASAPPRPGIRVSDEIEVSDDDVASLLLPPPGCSFHPRCPYRFEPCPVVVPELQQAERKHHVACHLYSDWKSASTPAR